MGVTIDFDCWDGACGFFHDWRSNLAAAAGMPPLDDMEGYCKGGIKWETLRPSPLHLLLNHSDCGGEIAHRDLAPLADSLRALLPLLGRSDRAAAVKFIRGLRRADEVGKPVKFH